MNVIKWNRVLYLLLIIAAIVSLITWLTGDMMFDVGFVFDCVANSASVISIVAASFCTYFWKCKIFKKWLVRAPNLNGRWVGKIHSDWVDETMGKKTPEIIATLTIKQSLFKISCVLDTNESSSNSISSNFLIDEDNQVLELVYVYQNNPNQNIQFKSNIHIGTAKLKISSDNDGYILKGNYWTNRGTSGEMKFSCKVEK